MQYDYHVHSLFSPDCDTPLEDILERAIELGLKEVAIVDHYNPNYPVLQFLNEPLSDADFETMCAVADRYADRVRLVKGIENGILLDTIADNDRAAALHPYDFVMASFHSMDGCELNSHALFDGRTVEQTYIYYYNYIYEALKLHTDFDVLGHLNLLERYYDEKPDVSVYWDLVEAILRLLAEGGRGLEINTSNVRYGHPNVSLPTKRMLETYRAFGGETVTIGSDAHFAKDVGSDLDHACELLASAGFRYFATFKDRKPTYVPLP